MSIEGLNRGCSYQPHSRQSAGPKCMTTCTIVKQVDGNRVHAMLPSCRLHLADDLRTRWPRPRMISLTLMP